MNRYLGIKDAAIQSNLSNQIKQYFRKFQATILEYDITVPIDRIISVKNARAMGLNGFHTR